MKNVRHIERISKKHDLFNDRFSIFKISYIRQIGIEYASDICRYFNVFRAFIPYTHLKTKTYDFYFTDIEELSNKAREIEPFSKHVSYIRRIKQ